MFNVLPVPIFAPPMKAFTLILLLIAVTGQFTKALFIQDSPSKLKVEIPWEDCEDDDSEKDTSNQEEDRTFYSHEVYSLTGAIEKGAHSTFYHFNKTEQIIEVVSPPPKG